MNVKAILEAKGTRVVTIRPDASIAVAIHKLQLENIGALVVSQDGAHVRGLLTERDIVAGLAKHGAAVLDRRVEDLMIREVATCGVEDSVRDVMATMTWRRTRHVPVIESDALRGIVSIGDLVKARLEELELETNVLRDRYFASRSP